MCPDQPSGLNEVVHCSCEIAVTTTPSSHVRMFTRPASLLCSKHSQRPGRDMVGCCHENTSHKFWD